VFGEEFAGPVGVQDDLVDGQPVQGATRLGGGLRGRGRGQRGGRIGIRIWNGTGIVGEVVITIQIRIGIQIAIVIGKLDVVPVFALFLLILDTVCVYGWVRDEGGAISTNGSHFRGYERQTQQDEQQPVGRKVCFLCRSHFVKCCVLIRLPARRWLFLF